MQQQQKGFFLTKIVKPSHWTAFSLGFYMIKYYSKFNLKTKPKILFSRLTVLMIDPCNFVSLINYINALHFWQCFMVTL